MDIDMEDTELPPSTPTPSLGIAQSQPSQPSSFEFVENDDRGQIRSHAMRESWKKRGRRAGSQNVRSQPVSLRQAGPSVNVGEPSSGEEDPGDDRLFPRDYIFIDVRHTLKIPKASHAPRKWKVSSTPNPRNHGFRLYQTPNGNDGLDPFNWLHLQKDDQELLFHWVNVYAPTAFGLPTESTFSPMRDLYLPIDLSQEASVQTILAHSASHMAYLRGERSSAKAVMHKMTAIRLVNEYLNDPIKSISDEAFSTVMRLITFERYWGTEETWRLHRKGLAQMIKKRGGLSTVTDWRLEMRVQLISLLPVPRWNRPVWGTAITEPPNNEEEREDFSRPHSDFINFFQNLNSSIPDLNIQYPFISRTITFLRSANIPAKDEDRFMCLVHIAIILKTSINRGSDLRWLNESLRVTESVWSKSIASLRWLLLQGMGRGPYSQSAMKMTERLEVVANQLRENEERKMEHRLLGIIMGTNENADQSWNMEVVVEQ